MKRYLLAVLVGLLVPLAAHAQDDETAARKYLQGIGVSETDITRVFEIQDRTRHDIRDAQLELNILKAELEKELFPDNVDMQKVQVLLQQSLQWKMKSELATIQEHVEIRKLLGDVKYAEYTRFLTRQRQQDAHDSASIDPQTAD
jgi:hypothetical protein